MGLRENSDRLPVTSSLDLRLQKRFNFSGTRVMLFATVYNVFDQKGEEYGDERLLHILQDCRDNKVRNFNERILEEIKAFGHNSMIDDITMIVLHCEEKKQ